MPRKHSGVFGKTVLWYNTCFTYPYTDSRKLKEKHLFCMKPTTIEKSFIVKIREEPIDFCKGENSE